MATNNLITRAGVQALIPEDVSNEILVNLTSQSAALSLFRRIPMSTAQTRMPVLAALPTAYFVNGDTGLKQTTEVDWTNKFLNVEELACIIPVSESVLDDTDYDLWGAVRPLVEQAIGRVLDAAIFFGVNKPASWPTAIVPAAIAAAQRIVGGTSAAAAGGIAQDLNLLMGQVEASGYDPNAFITSRIFRAKLRGIRDTLGQRLLDVAADGNMIDGNPVKYVMPGLWPSGTGAAQVITGDFTQGILGTRKDMTWKLLDQAVIQDPSGAIQFNLPQQDMVAMRVTFRVAYQVANTINYQQMNEVQRYPFAILQSP